MAGKISELVYVTPLDGLEDIEIVKDGVSKRSSTQDIADLAGLPYKLWAGYISQSGDTAAPTAVEMFNSLGRTITFTRDVAGGYNIIASGFIFATNKVIVQMTGCGGDGGPKLFSWSVMNNVTIPFYCFDPADTMTATDGCRLFVTIMVFP